MVRRAPSIPVALALLLAATSARAQFSNLLENPTFDVGVELDGWDVPAIHASAVSWSPDDAQSQVSSGSLEITNDQFVVRSINQCIPIVQGEPYTYGAWVFVALGQSLPGQAGVTMDFFSDENCQSDLGIGQSVAAGTAGSVDPVQPDTWQLLTRTAPLGASTRSVDFELYMVGPQSPATVVVQLDDAFFVPECGAMAGAIAAGVALLLRRSRRRS